MRFTRREILVASGTVVTAGLSGCQTPLFSETASIDIELFNYTADPQQVQIQVLRTDRDEYGEAEVFSRNFEVPAPAEDESAGTVREENIVERRPYLLRARPKNGNGQWHHHHYYLSGSTTDEDSAYFDVRLYREEATDIVYPRFFM